MNRRQLALAVIGLTVLGLYSFRHELERAYLLRSGGCAANSVIGVWVHPIQDARTGADIPHELALQGTLIVQDGNYIDTAPLLAGAASDRPGTYDVTVRLPGYQAWSRARVRVAPRGCSVRTANVRATLQPVR